MAKKQFRSLRIRLMLPLITASVVSAVAVAAVSAWLGAAWAHESTQQRFRGIERALAQSSFPMTDNVLRLLADLTSTELMTMSAAGTIERSTVPLQGMSARQLLDPIADPSAHPTGQAVTLATVRGRQYQVFALTKPVANSDSPDRAERIWVLFDQEQIRAMRWRAALLPLLTGLSTTLLLGGLSLALTGRLVGRLNRLQRRVEAVAAGSFDAGELDTTRDEVGQLASAVHQMASQLKELWKAVRRQQGQQLLHQISSGMAHQLRNTLTGARMALELIARRASGPEELAVALRQLQQAEDYIRRLLLVALGQTDADRPAAVSDCIQDVQASLTPVARHLKIGISWQIDPHAAEQMVQDGPTLAAAASNLILNALQAGKQVGVQLQLEEKGSISLRVVDDGPGIDPRIAAEIFEPFVTTKPEGVGLGLPLVRRAAEHLHGEVKWSRLDGRTIFEFKFPGHERENS